MIRNEEEVIKELNNINNVCKEIDSYYLNKADDCDVDSHYDAGYMGALMDLIKEAVNKGLYNISDK
jgi:hypothetical protein